MPMIFMGKFFKGLGSIILMLCLLILGLIFVVAPGLAANLGLFFINGIE
ncbi:MAG: hypothetical protein ABFD18_00805 [Syntrophomonas sp.]